MRLFPGLSVLTLGVASVDRASLFYERLGWRRSHGASTRAETIFELNNLLLRLTPSDALAADLGASESDVYTAFSQHYGDAEAISRTLETADLAGARVLSGVRAHGRGAHAVFADPDGNIWTLAFDPRMIPSADGGVRPRV